MPVEYLATAATAAKLGESVSRAVSQAAVAAKNQTVQSSALLTTLKAHVRRRTLYAYGSVEDYTESKFAPSPLLGKLTDAHHLLHVADNRSRVLFAPPSSGKTSAAKAFMKNVLGDDRIDCPGLMFTGAGIVNYYEFIAACFPDASHDPATVMKCLIASLCPSKTAALGSPWLILDEFNTEGVEGINMVFAESLYREVAEKQLNFTILFVTQKKAIAKKLLETNGWQKIAPLPGLTNPDARTINSAEEAPEWDATRWTPVEWSKLHLSMVIFLHFPELKEDPSATVMENGHAVCSFLAGNETPTVAISKAAELCSHRRRGNELHAAIAAKVSGDAATNYV